MKWHPHLHGAVMACGFALVLGLAQTAVARQAVIVTHSGRTWQGEVLEENDKMIVLMIANIRTPIRRENIKEIEFLKTVADEYAEKVAALAEDDFAGRYELAYWLYEQKSYDLCLKELFRLRKKLPADAQGDSADLARRVNLLLRAVRAEKQKLLDEVSRPVPVGPQPVAKPDRPDRAKPDRPDRSQPDRAERVEDDRELLDEKAINLIRVYEIDLGTRPPVRVPQDVEKKIFEDYSERDAVPKGVSERRRFRSLPGYKKLELLFEIRAKELYGEVKVAKDPPALMDFKTEVHRRYVLSYCGTDRCHGGGQAGSLWLFQKRPSSDETTYTNFYVLDQFENNAGRMIDRDNPKQSLLIQYGLQREAAAYPHPDVPGWNPRFRTDLSQDPLYQGLVNWMGGKLYKPKPDYGVSYKITPGQSVAKEDAGEGKEAAEPAKKG